MIGSGMSKLPLVTVDTYRVSSRSERDSVTHASRIGCRRSKRRRTEHRFAVTLGDALTMTLFRRGKWAEREL